MLIYGDESGTMPLNDGDKPFIAATVSCLDNPPMLIEGSNNNEKLVAILKNLNATPSAMVVKPYPGYSNAIKTKYSKMQIMARATRLVTGANANYLDRKTLTNGFEPRNMIWCHAMLTSIGYAVLNTAFNSTINEVRIILDQKTMRPSMRTFFKEMVVQQMGVGTSEYLSTLLHMNSSVIGLWKSRVRFSAESTYLNWNDECAEFKNEFGLRLADRLSRKIYQSQSTGDSGIETLLKDAGHADCIVDLSRIVTRLDKRVIENFKEKTGLPEPKEF